MEIGTLDIGVPFMITVAVPLYLITTLVMLPRDVEACPALMDILKSFMVCIWGSLPFSIAILNVELNVGEFIFILSSPMHLKVSMSASRFCRSVYWQLFLLLRYARDILLRLSTQY